jgi:hypothetical protein
MFSRKSNGAPVDEDVISTLVQTIYGAKLEAYRQDAIAQAEIDNDERLQDIQCWERERYQEEFAQYQADVEADIDQRVAQQLRQIREELSDQYEDQAQSLSRALAEEKARREAAEQVVLTLVEALLPTPGRTYALARHCALNILPFEALNTLLARYGQQLVGVPVGSGFRIDCGTYQYSAIVRNAPNGEALA